MKFNLIEWLTHHKIDSNARFLLAVSAGVDSMVLWHHFRSCEISHGIAHVNYSLRKNAKLDLDLIKKVALPSLAPVHHITFDTHFEAKERKMGIQEIARQLRYQWFKDLCTQNQYQYIVTAHHQNDTLETFMFNLMRGTGIRGLTGIPEIRDNILRPFIALPKKEIIQYAENHQIEFRIDPSNSKPDYTRNKIRLNLIPELIKFDARFPRSIASTMNNLHDTTRLLEYFIKIIKSQILTTEEDRTIIDLPPIADYPNPDYLLFEILKNFGFNRPQSVMMWSAFLENRTGAIFNTGKYSANMDREKLRIQPIQQQDYTAYVIHQKDLPSIVKSPKFTLELKVLNNTDAPQKSKNEELIDVDKIKWPISLRTWQPGDRFQPLGMGGKSKKVQDFLTDIKISRQEKQNVWLMVDQEKVLGIMGSRIDERIKISQKTQACLLIRWLK